VRARSRHLKAVVRRRVALAYRLYLPSTYSPAGGRRWPVLLFLHGMGERGEDLQLLERHGPPKLAAQGEELPFLLAAPQCPVTSTWPMELESLQALIRSLIRTQAVDTSRIYLTGLSMGGYGCWHLAESLPHAFAAVAPVCGGTLPDVGFPERLAVIKQLPVWAFHGAKDEVVPLEETRLIVRFLRKIGAPVKLTVYRNAGHDSWSATYRSPRLYEWLLRQRNRRFALPQAG
jgi:predicted peptidase